jgi:hypothetical protein
MRRNHTTGAMATVGAPSAQYKSHILDRLRKGVRVHTNEEDQPPRFQRRFDLSDAIRHGPRNAICNWTGAQQYGKPETELPTFVC